jgi:hypothetical protein
MGEASAVPAASRAAAVLLWIVAAGWGLPAPWLMWWVLVRGRLPVLPIIGEPNGGPFYFNFSRGTFVGLLGASLVLAFAQGGRPGYCGPANAREPCWNLGCSQWRQRSGTASLCQSLRCSPSLGWFSLPWPGGVSSRRPRRENRPGPPAAINAKEAGSLGRGGLWRSRAG